MQSEPRDPPIRIVFAAPPDRGVVEHLGGLPGAACEVCRPPAGDDLAATARRADILVTRSSQRVDRNVLEAGRSAGLRVVVQASSGSDNIDRACAEELGIQVLLVDPGNATSVAEMTLLGLLAAFRRAKRYWDETPRGVWPDRESVQDRELRGRTLGLVGLGRVGSRVARRARAFGMVVLAVDPYIEAERFEEAGAGRVESLAALVGRVDALSLHCPLTGETRGMIDRSVFERMRPRSVLVNTARGPVVVRDDLEWALDHGPLETAVLDVHDPEPVEAGGLAAHPGVLATPHVAGHTIDSHAARARNLSAALADLVARWPGVDRPPGD